MIGEEIKMDDRELAGRLDILQAELLAVKEQVSNIEAVIQQYWSDFMNDKEEVSNQKKKTIKIRSKEDGEQD